MVINNKQKDLIHLSFIINGKEITRCFCKRNIEWFALTVSGNIREAEKISHCPSTCNLLHYNPKLFEQRKLCGYAIAGIPCLFGMKCNMLHSLEYPPVANNKYENSIEKNIIINDKSYNSAGVLKFIKDENGKLCIILYKSSYKVNRGKNIGNYYCGIAGGGINENDNSVEETASRELYEESKKTLVISADILHNLKDLNYYVEIPGKTLSGKRKTGLFACYICKLPTYLNIINKYFNDNKKIINNYDYNSIYNETSDLILFPIENVIQQISNLNFNELKPMKIENNKGTFDFIDERTLKCLWKIITNSNVLNIYKNDSIDNYGELSKFDFDETIEKINTFYFS